MNKDTKLSEATPASDTHQLFTSTEDLNKAEPQYRDLEITVDGLNVVDIQMAGPGVWVPRFTVQISGDQGIDKTTGQRRVFLVAAEYLRAVLLNNGTGDGTKMHAFVPHANISRDDLDGDCAAAVTAANAAISGLLALYNGVKIDESDELANEGHYECYTKALHIVVRTVDFDLVEKKVLSADEFAKLQAAIDAPASPTPTLQELVRGKDGEVNPAAFADAPTDSFLGDATLNHTTTVVNGGESLDEAEPDVRNTTKLFDAIPHKRFEREDNGVRNVFWVPETMDVVIDQEHDIDDNLLMVIIAEDDNGNLEWRVTGRK